MAKPSKKTKKIKKVPLKSSVNLTASIPPENDTDTTVLDPPELPLFEECVIDSYKSRDYQACIKTIERILKVTSQSNSSHYKVLLAAANTMVGKNFKRSHNLLNDVLKANPFDAYALYGKGVAYYFEKKFDESLNYFDRAIAVDEDGMKAAKDMKIKAQIEGKQARIVLTKIKIDFSDGNLDDFDENKKEKLSSFHKKAPKKAQKNTNSTIITDFEATADHESEENPNPVPKSENKPSINSFHEVSTSNLDSSLEYDSADIKPTTSANSFAQQYFNNGLDLYMLGELEKSLKFFEKSLNLEPDFEEADEMSVKAQELIELLDVVNINMSEKSYAAVVEICTDGLDIDEGNIVINRKFYFQRGLAYFHLGNDVKSIKDYDEYERLGRLLKI